MKMVRGRTLKAILLGVSRGAESWTLERLLEVFRKVCDAVEPSHDPDGTKLPFAGHIRKAYPRNDTSASIPTSASTSRNIPPAGPTKG
jgi:hypothetical protein